MNGNEQWKNLKTLGNNEKIEKEIDRMRIEYKSKQPQTLFHVWAKQPTTNQNPTRHSSPTSQPIETETISTTKSDDNNTLSTPSSSRSTDLAKRNTVYYFS